MESRRVYNVRAEDHTAASRLLLAAGDVACAATAYRLAESVLHVYIAFLYDNIITDREG